MVVSAELGQHFSTYQTQIDNMEADYKGMS